MVDPVDVLKTALASIYESGEYADFTIICGPYHFKIHKAVVSAQSEYFRAAFKTNAFKEGEEGVIELKPESDFESEGCDDPDTIKLMVDFFYHLDYAPRSKDCKLQTASAAQPAKDLPPEDRSSQAESELESEFSESDNPIIDMYGESFGTPLKRKADMETMYKAGSSALEADPYMFEHAKVFAVAVKYQVPALRDLAASKFQKAINKGWDHSSLGQVIMLVFASTPDEANQLRDVVVSILNRRSRLLDKPEIEAAVCSINTLAYRLLKMKR